jgi:hypothetical protein
MSQPRRVIHYGEDKVAGLGVCHRSCQSADRIFLDGDRDETLLGILRVGAPRVTGKRLEEYIDARQVQLEVRAGQNSQRLCMRVGVNESRQHGCAI